MEGAGFDPQLERRLSAELRREMAVAERDAAALAARTRTLTDVAVEAVARGDTVAVASGRTEFVGVAIYARGTLLSMAGQAALIEVHLSVIDWLRTDARSDSGGQVSPREAESFAARLGLLELTGEQIELITVGAQLRLVCEIAAVARDHVLARARDGRSWAIPIDRIAFAVREQPSPTWPHRAR